MKGSYGKNQKVDPCEEWKRLQAAKTFNVNSGKNVEFDVFVKLCLATGKGRESVNELKRAAHDICVMCAEAGYLSAT